MRLFYAIDPDASARTVASDAMRALQPTVSAKWAEPAGLHVTLVFLGEVEVAAMPGLEAVAAAVARRHRPFRVQLSKAGVFGEPPRVLWLGLTGELRPLEGLQADLGEALRVEAEAGGYRPHLTLARARGRKGDAALTAGALALEALASAPFEVTAFTLYQSEGGRYVALARHPLAGARAG